MRITLTLDGDVLVAAKALARQENKSLGEVVSELARRALHRPAPPSLVTACLCCPFGALTRW